MSDRVVFITGGARGQGRAHALAFAAEGAKVAVCDLAAPSDTAPYELATPDDLAETVRMVEDKGGTCLAITADVRDTAEIEGATRQVLDRFGQIDVCIANAGICGFAPVWEITDAMWDDMIATDLSGVFKTFRAVVPHMLERGSGRLIATSSMAGRMGNANLGHYVAAKWGVIGLVKTLALEVAARGITVNAVCPTTVDTPMVHNPAMYGLFAPHVDNPGVEVVRPSYERMNPMSLAWLDPDEVAQAVVYLASNAARSVSGAVIELGFGTSARMH
jgi:SDR family mycofactocin-dependent oxidoreductase